MEPPAGTPSTSLPAFDAIRQQIERQADPESFDLAWSFAKVFFSRVPGELFQERSADVLARMALGAFRFIQEARPDRVDAQVLNPDVDLEGWYAPVTVIRTNISERPFIVDTIREFVHSRDLAIEHYIYLVLHVERDEEGRLVAVRSAKEDGARESLIHCEVSRIADAGLRERIADEVETRLHNVVQATDDFGPMVKALNDVIWELADEARRLPQREAELTEVQEFLRWLENGGFVFLGYRSYDIVEPSPGSGPALVVRPDSGLGILRDESRSRYSEPVLLEEMESSLRGLVRGGPILIITKTNAESPVHRRARMDYIGVKKLDDSGEVVGEHRWVGLFTSRAYSEEAEKIPLLRDKLHSILESAGAQEGTHDYKEIITIFNSLPKEELFLTSTEEIRADVRTILTSYHTQEVRVSVREDPLERGASVMVILPKEKFSGAVRRSIEQALTKGFGGEVLNYHLTLGSGDQARLHFYMSAESGRLREVAATELEETVGELIRSWGDRVREGLERVRPPDEARRLATEYVEASSPEYRAATRPSDAVDDILELEAMAADELAVAIELSNPEASAAVAGGEPVTELRLYLRQQRLVLSDFMPILENAGLRVIAVTPFEIGDPGAAMAIVYTFAVQGPDGRPLDVEARGTLLRDTILAVRCGDATNDPLNALVLSAGLAWREVDVLRAFAGYAFQLGAVPSRLSLPSALRKHPEVARLLFDIFRIRFDPAGSAGSDERSAAAASVERQLGQALHDVGLLSDDRALRRLFALIKATTRTNYFRNGGKTPTRRSGGVPYVSLKVAGRDLDVVVRTPLLYEVWVHSSRMEGIHLRGAPVARGGIRWSDRPDDFRTEIMSLVRTQVVKNAVIVPAGAKGGFVTLRTLHDRERMAAEAREQYATLIRGLLDVTDNLDSDGGPVPPEQLVRYDDPDPYLVVAADKGTAQFSDLANSIAAEYDFWLGDAFASGGSRGYDHKEMGITARGAWKCVQRHFRELGKDIQEEPFTVVGIGDMSGDVFGNGMLLSKTTRLVAAFDHRHVFIDPDPDPAASWMERKRLFELERSTWEDYDRSLLSEGGMIVPRGVKEVELSPRVRDVLGLGGSGSEPEGSSAEGQDSGAAESVTMDGEALVRAILRAPAELLWNGGIGTYVKATVESHADVGDPSNDAVRVDGADLRCRVVGEGGNLGFTQKARIEYALEGGRINTDALDNSGGVDLSDREVNLKILLGPALASGVLSGEERNRLLGDLQEEVAESVLGDNESQSLAISLDERRSSNRSDHFREVITALERAGILDRIAEDLPTMETLVERAEEGLGLVRPELCVLLAHSKLHLTSQLLSSGLPDDPGTAEYLRDYFPVAARQAVGPEGIQQHRLRREIIASRLTNDLVDLMGSTFVQRLSRETGRSPADVAWAWAAAAQLASHRTILTEIFARGAQLPTPVTYRWLLGLARVLERTTRWVLNHVEPGRSVADVVEENADGLDAVRKAFPDVVLGEDRDRFIGLVGELETLGAGDGFARSLITLRFLDQLLDILSLARQFGVEPELAARAFYEVSEILHFPWIENAITETAEPGRWDQQAAQALLTDLTDAHRAIAARVILESAGRPVEESAESVILGRSRAIERLRSLVDEVRADDRPSLSGLSVVVREVTSLARDVTSSGGNSSSGNPSSGEGSAAGGL